MSGPFDEAPEWESFDRFETEASDSGGVGPLIAVIVLLVCVVGVGGLLLLTSGDPDPKPTSTSEVCVRVQYELETGKIPAKLCYNPSSEPVPS